MNMVFCVFASPRIDTWMSCKLQIHSPTYCSGIGVSAYPLNNIAPKHCIQPFQGCCFEMAGYSAVKPGKAHSFLRFLG